MLRKLWAWVLEEVWEKVNVLGTWRELKALGVKHGRRFFVVAFLWELIEDVLFPILSYRAGHPELIPVFLVLHFEPVVYPIFFWCFKMWDRMQGREPWEPDRLAASTYGRTTLKMVAYRIVALFMFFLVLSKLGMSMWLLTLYALGMTIFGFVHDRLWHDSNFGINVVEDTVRPIRVVAKAITYRIASALIMSCLFYGLLGTVPQDVWLYQTTMFGLHLLMGLWWAQSPLGIYPVNSENRH